MQESLVHVPLCFYGMLSQLVGVMMAIAVVTNVAPSHQPRAASWQLFNHLQHTRLMHSSCACRCLPWMGLGITNIGQQPLAVLLQLFLHSRKTRRIKAACMVRFGIWVHNIHQYHVSDGGVLLEQKILL